MKIYGTAEVHNHVFLISALDRGEYPIITGYTHTQAVIYTHI
jgi:hypothetical protein